MKREVKILLAEDDVNLGFVVRDNLEQKGFDVDLCKDGQEALKNFREHEYHICILDVMMPKMDGFELATRIRGLDSHTPILFLTAKTLKEDRLRGFLVGGDDYITKPFSIEELVCRINVFLKRSGTKKADTMNKVPLGRYIFDPQNLQLTLEDREISLTQMESDVLQILYDHLGEVIKRNEILNEIWGSDDYFNGRSLDVFISRLRKLLSDDPDITIVNQHGVGFKLKISK
jgi:DNA-binding response OmpR family regulator